MAASFEDAVNRFNKITGQSVKYQGTGWIQIGFELKNAKGEYGTKDGVAGFMYTMYIGNGSGDVAVGKANQGEAWPGLNGENAPNSAYTMRDNNVTWSTLFKEFKNGTGPTYSGFGANHPMTKSLKNSYVAQLAAVKFMLNGGKQPLVNYDVPYGLIGIPMSGSNMTEQFLGGVRISIYPSQLGYIYILNNTTDRYSGGLHMMNAVPRNPNSVTPYGTIYQRFMWIVK